MTELSTFIKRRRTELGLSQAELSRRSGLEPSGDQIAAIEHGRRGTGLRAKTILGLSRGLRADPRKILRLAAKADQENDEKKGKPSKPWGLRFRGRT